MKRRIAAGIMGLCFVLTASGCMPRSGISSEELEAETTEIEESAETAGTAGNGTDGALTAENPESPNGVEEEYYLSESIPAENFAYTIEPSPEQGDQIFTVQNISEQDYSYIQADMLFYDGNDQIVDYYSGLYLYNLFAGSEQILRFAPSLTSEQYDHVEVLFSGDRMADEKTADPAGIRIEEQARLADNRIVAKCVNDTGEDISTASFQIDYYKGEKKVATNYTEASMLVKDRVFVVSLEAPSDGWYEPLPDDYFDSWEITVVRAAAFAAE